MKLTAKQQSALARSIGIDGMSPVGEAAEVGTHKDCDIMLQPFRKEGDSRLYGFLYASSYLAGDLFDYTADSGEVFEVETFEETVTRKRFRRCDGKAFD